MGEVCYGVSNARSQVRYPSLDNQRIASPTVRRLRPFTLLCTWQVDTCPSMSVSCACQGPSGSIPSVEITPFARVTSSILRSPGRSFVYMHSPFQATSGSASSDLKCARASSVDASNHPLPGSLSWQPGQHNGDDVTPPTGELGVCAPVSSLSARASCAILSRRLRHHLAEEQG